MDAVVPSRCILTIPNAISVLRLAAIPLFAVLIARRQDVAALAVLIAAGASDWVDGVIARRLNQVTLLGQILDPIADRLLIFVTLVGLVWRAAVPWWLLAVILAREATLGVLVLLLARRGYGPLPVHFLGKVGTALLLYALPVLLLAQSSARLGAAAWVIGWAFAIWGVACYWAAGFVYLRQGIALLRPEPS